MTWFFFHTVHFVCHKTQCGTLPKAHILMGYERMHTQTHTPGLLAVICIRRAICLRSDRGYPNKRLAWDFLPPPSFFIFFLSGPSLSVRKKKKKTRNIFEKLFHLKWRVHCYSDVFLLLLYLYAEKQMTSVRFERKDKKKHTLKPAKCRKHFLSSPPVSTDQFWLNTDMHEL